MWIVNLALRRPYTFIVLAIVILLLGVFAILRTPTDIFPNINIPVVGVIWRYTGLSPEEMATRLVLGSERNAQTTVNDVAHTESQSLSGTSVVKYFFQPNAREEMSFAQITGVSQTALRQAPPGTNPPYILAYNASSVPILQLALSSPSLSEAELFDLGNNIIRTGLATVQGASMPYPYGGLQRQVQVDLDPDALRAQGLSGNDVTNAIASQNLILPAGTQKIGDREYFVEVNASPQTIDELNNLPVTTRNGSIVYVRDVAHVRDGSPPQTNIVRRDGHRGVLMSVLKTGSASTLDIIKNIKERLPGIRAALPADFHIDLVGDQSVFVRSAIEGVVREAVIAAALTALMILLFLGSWRSTLIIAISIPLSILASIACLSWLGETINIMTLGGLALAVGILVDDATVTIENINYHLEHGEQVEPAILDGCARDRPAGAGLDAGDLHRVRADVHAGRHRALPLHPARRGGGVRHAGFVPPVAHAGADARQVLAAAPRPACRGARDRGLRAAAGALRRGLRAAARPLRRPARPRARRRSALLAAVPRRHGGDGTARLPVQPLAAGAGPGLLSRASTPGRSSCICAARPASGSMRPPRSATGWRPRSAR